MDILFIHGNYPAQFRHLCAGFGANPSHRTVFLTARRDADQSEIKGVNIAQYEQHRQASENTHHYLKATEDCVLQGQAILRSIDNLMQQGFRPQLVVFHGGMGLGMFLRDVLPDAILIGYFEWWFTARTTKCLVKDFDLNTQLTCGMRNLPTHHEIAECDIGVTPTRWQKSQFPRHLQSKLHVIFDGIDENFFHPPKKNHDQRLLKLSNRDTGETYSFPAQTPILSYATRGMEPLRGFPEFMRALPNAFQTIKDLHVVIAGADRCAYSYPAPTHNGSWKEHLLEEIGDKVPTERIHFTGLLNYQDYRSLLWRSNLHCYFTRPYVTSWSLFEAASCGARLLTNHGEATSNIAKPTTITMIDLDDQQAVNDAIIEELTKSQKGLHPRAEIMEGYSLSKNLKQWEMLINDQIKNQSNQSKG